MARVNRWTRLTLRKTSPPPAIHLKGQWLKDAVFEAGFTFSVMI
ncbi:hypothetical protein AB7V88_07970 [Providencia rettgeri]